MTLDEQNIRKIFRSLFLAHTENGDSYNLEAYQAMFPGHEELIASLYDRIELDSSASSDETEAAFFKLAGPGDLVSHYLLENEIGRGGQAVVFAATDQELHRRVAVKILTRVDLTGNSTLRRFRREAELCSKLNHPSICTVFESGIHNGMPFIAMELVEGETVARQIDSSRTALSIPESGDVFFEPQTPTPGQADNGTSTSNLRLPERTRVRQIVETFEQAARALHEAHDQGIIHRDIKPGNLMVRTNGVPVILDFGLAHEQDSDRMDLTQTGDFFGTPAYMSPEQLSAHRIRPDHRTDIFSLAVSLYEALTLQRPFHASSREEIYQAILTKDPKEPRRLNAAISRDLSIVILKALEKDRDRRYETAQDFADDLRRILDVKPILARPANPLLKLLRWTQRNRTVAALLVILPLVGLGAVSGANMVDTQRELREEEDGRRAAWKRLEATFDHLVNVQKNGALAMILQARTLASIDRDVDQLGDDARQWIRNKLSDPDPAVRRAGIGVIIQAADVGAADLLVDHCLNDKDNQVRIWCSQALFRIPDETLGPSLRRIYDESDLAACQVNALFGLAALRVPEASRLCLEFYENKEKSAALRRALAQNVLLLGTPGLEPMAEHFASTLNPKDLQNWGTVMEFYRVRGTPEARARLLSMSKDKKIPALIRKFAASILEQTSEKEVKEKADRP